MEVSEHNKREVELDFMKRTLQRQMVLEVEKKLEETVLPEIKKKIKDMAKEAVSNWSIDMASQTNVGAFDRTETIMITFVEHVLHENRGIKVPKIEER